ncbi:hypothetical protein J3R83DRAFT_11490 [Lanmaoa asiatica]|nr:hypothetical protein J3R83DRAFT_11490 [Lanmaoa asiatica]
MDTNLDALEYIITHVFCPLRLPGEDDHCLPGDQALVGSVVAAARAFTNVASNATLPEWPAIERDVGEPRSQRPVYETGSKSRCHSVRRDATRRYAFSVTFAHDESRADDSKTCAYIDVRAFLIRAQNAAVVFKKGQDSTLYSAFEVSPQASSVIMTRGKLICSYPGPAIEIPNAVFNDAVFRSELANFLVRMNEDELDPDTGKLLTERSAIDRRDTTDPRYITELLTGILRGAGRPAADVVRITKRIGDDVVVSSGSPIPWRRSSLWLLIRVVLQTTLEPSPHGRDSYKAFMLFFLARLAKEAIRAELSNDLLHFMSAKISRRLRKLGAFAPTWLSDAALETCRGVRRVLDDRWEQVQAAQRASPPHAFSELDLARDVQLSLLCSRDYLGNRLLGHDEVPSFPFLPDHRPRGTLENFLSIDGAFFTEAFRAEPHITLYDVEQAVERGIDAWVDSVVNADAACVKLEVLTKKYSSSAVKAYADNPEQLSIMLLTTIELWVALDRIATRSIPLLADFSPEVPTHLLQKLLLRKAGHLHRLRHVYRYLSRRHSQFRSGCSAFSSDVSEDAFAIRFFNQSDHLQKLADRIEAAAEREVDKKVAELKKANNRHAKLKVELEGVQHTYTTRRDGAKSHAVDCGKCLLEAKLHGMEMDVYEWPLPEDELHAAVVVFELECPVAFSMWRATTLHLLTDICSRCPRGRRAYLLSDYPALQRYFFEHPRSRITLASGTRPIDHRKLLIPAREEQVCVNNGIRYYLFDTQTNVPVAKALQVGEINIERYCTHKIQKGPYHDLQQYVDTTFHTSNEVLANQADCDKDLSIHEYIAFGHLRSDGVLQWLNILRELRDRSLGFRCTEVHSLLAQATTQVGPFTTSGEPKWHAELRKDAFGHALVNELETLLVDVEGNWLEGVTMNTISFLLSRLLASKPGHAVSQHSLALLRSVRTKVFVWVKELLDKLTRTPGDEELRGLLRDIAAACRSTFDVDPDMVREMVRSAEDVEVLVSCAIVIHDNTPNKTSALSSYSQLLLDRDRRLSIALESVLSDVIEADIGQGMDLAIRKVWPDYRPGSKWSPLPHPDSRWLSCTTASTTTQCAQVVHFNLLDGSLLVGGKPLGRLPSAIVRHPLYNRVFGEQVLDVIPGDLPGMDYSTRGMISDHQVYFSLIDETLVIRAKTAAGDSDIIELIPREKLENDIPAVLIKGHIHWLNLSSSIMEIRPFDKLWEVSSENWKIDCTPGRYRMSKGHELLIDVRSQSWTMVSSLLKPLDAPENLLVTVSPVDSDQPSSSLQLSVTLPRYGLSFYVDEDGDLQSHNIRGMVYDDNQSMGTLFGLVNRLVLRPKLRENVNVGELVPRCVLIPEGTISFQMDGHHVRVEVDTRGPALQRVTYQTYRIDTDLGCLAGNVSLTNKLYRVYLHALTNSGCCVDPLTGRSGIEEALGLLRSASCQSIMKFGSRDAELLRSIASLCPPRSLHSRYKNMQIVHWLSLPVLSQSQQLFLAARATKEHIERVQLFHEGWDSDSLKKFPTYDDNLLARGLHRAAYLLPSETSEQLPKADCDVMYLARDVLETDSPEHRTCLAATTIFNWSINRIEITMTDIMNLIDSWKGTISSNASVSLTYHSSWLNPRLPAIWINVYNLLRSSKKSRDRFKLLFSLPAMVYCFPELCNMVPTLLAVALHPTFRTENPPAHSDYNISDGYQPSRDTVSDYVLASARDFFLSPESSIPAGPRQKTARALNNHRRGLYDARLDLDATTVGIQVLAAWPSLNPPSLSLSSNAYNVESLKLNIRALFQSCIRNISLREHLIRVQTALRVLATRTQTPPPSPPTYKFEPALASNMHFRTSWSVPLDQLIFTRPAPLPQARQEFLHFTVADERTSSSSGAHELRQLDCYRPRESDGYLSIVTRFCNEVSPTPQVSREEPSDEHIKVLAGYYSDCKESFSVGLTKLKKVLGPEPSDDPSSNNASDQAFEMSGQWPHFTPEALFRCIASTSPIKLTEAWKKYIVRLAMYMLELQRARRILRLVLDGFHEDFYKEFENGGWDGWDPEAQPDWLLIQLQGNFLVRRVQADVAKEMITPRSRQNTAMQLNMGEGKSSVIVPIVVALLADGDQLVRVIVPKALTAQMFQLLVDRLGGLINRRIYYLPFSRSLPLDSERVASLHALLSECMRERGILVVQPDHVLSLKLVSVEKQLAIDTNVAGPLLKLQRWLHSHSRDILDESDEILHVRYQLVYTIGLQQHMEGFPERWTTTQQVLSVVKKNALSLRNSFKEGIEYEGGPSGSFPHLRILQRDAAEALVSRIARDALDGLLPNFNFQQLNLQVRDAVFSFITDKDVSPSTCKIVEDYSRQSTLWNGLLLLRGILATEILLFAFRDQRWRVDYGLAPKRTMLAVPYRAKDVPAPKAEFGHPDVAIVLTCLSYYYGGLTEEQLKVSFEILLKQDDPSLDYGHWVQDCPSVPTSLRNYTGINLKSSEQWTTLLVPLFSRNHATVDFFLARVVFPKEAKEFPSKLACSGWDLAEKKEQMKSFDCWLNCILGFSGTNDGRYLLPLHITQRDPDHQRGTNAKVLSYLLQPENKHYMCMTKESGERRTTQEFLEILVAQEPEIRVLLDVGAQMLDLQNHELAKAWLDISPDASAAIYFDDDDELTVRTRDGSTQLLLSSPFAQQLDQCVVYLDDAHTRGTDIKFPSGFRAAVTLGPKITKDRLAQGCMRMRKLGTGHSIMFFAPLEVEWKIRALSAKQSEDDIHTIDILRWAINETCSDIQQRASHWAQQGMTHQARYDAWSRFCADELTPEQLSTEWLQPEVKSLVELYAPHHSSNATPFTVPEIRERCVSLGIASLRPGGMDEEQEREVVHEVEREREVERPPKASPAKHSVSDEVASFVTTGAIPNRTTVFRPIFTTLNNTSAVTNESRVWSRWVLATEDFCRTIVPSEGGSPSKMDEYLRPVQWIVSSKSAVKHVLVILSPHEVGQLLLSIRKSGNVDLHLYTPRTTKLMKPSDDLSLYSIPEVSADWTPPQGLMSQLNVFAGQLYLSDHAAYIRLCRFLCVYAQDLQDEEDMVVQYDGFIKPEHRRGSLGGQTQRTFQSTPLPFVKVLLGLRRKGMSFAQTHMGKLLEGRLLTERDFEGREDRMDSDESDILGSDD